MAKTFTFEEASAPSTFTFEEALGPAGGADAGLIQSARSAPMLYGEDPINGPMQPQSSMPVVGPQTAVVTDPSGDGSVLKGVKFDPPDADPYLNRQARDRSVSPQSKMFTPAQELDRVDAYISRGEKIQAALKKAGYSSVDEFQAARQRSSTRQRIAEELPVLSGVASGAANQVAGLANFPQVTAEFVNKVFVDPVLTATGGSQMPSAPKTPGTESLMRAAADYMPKVGKKEFEDVVGTDEFRPWLIANMAQNSPQMVMSLASMLAPAVRPFVLPGMGATSAGNAYLQGDDPRVAMAKGAVEVGSEMLPLGVFDKIQSAIASMPRSAQKRFLADVGKRVMSGGAAVAATALTGGAEEWIAQYGGNVLDKYAQGKNIPLDKGAAGAYVLGAAMGTGMGMPHIISAMGDQSPQAQAERELAALLNGGQFSDLRGDEFANLNPNLAESDPGPTSSDQPASAADIFAQRWGKPKPAVPDPVATVQSATTVDGAITAAAQAVDAAFNERDRQQAKSEQAVSNIARILGTEIPDVGTAAAVPGVVEPASGGGAPDAAAGVGAGVGTAGPAGQPVDTGGVGGQPTGRPVPLGAGQPGALNFAQPPGPVRQITVTPAGTLTAIGDPQSLVRLLKSAGVTNVIPASNGVTVGKSQASLAEQVLNDFVAAPPENFEQDFQQELEREYQADIKAQLQAKRNPKPVQVEKKGQSPLRRMLRAVGIKPELAADITGERNKVRANNVLPFTFRKNGAQIDELVRIARERGFLTQDEDDITAGRRLVEMIQADLRGDRQESTETIEDAMRGEQDAEIARAAARYGLDISGMEIGQVANAVNRIERRLEKARADGLRREAAAEARLEREAIQAADRRAAGPDRILDDLDDVPENATLEDAMRALGFTEQEISDAVAQESRRAQADRAGSGDVVAAAAGPAQGSDRRGESQARQEAGGAESRPQDLLGDAPNASQQAAARLRAEREEQDRRRQQAAPEAGGFMLSGSDRARDVGAAAGQGDLPAGPPAAAPAPSPASTARNRFGAAFYNLDAENAGDLHALLSHKFAKRGALTRDDVPMEFSEGVDTAAWMNLKDAIAQNPQEFLAYLAEKAARAPAPTAAGASPPAQQAELATTDAQRKQAADHAKDLGGRVVWQRGELALIEGFSLLSGDSVYVAAKGDVRTRVDIKSYTGNGYTEAERAELMQARADAVRAADEALARNPDGPFSAGPLVFAEDIPANVQGVVRGWIGLLGLDGARIVVTTPKSGAAMADGLAGKFRRIGKASLSGDNTNGTMQPLGGDDFHIAVRPNVSTLKMLEVLAHELGHIVERRAFAQADPATQQAIREAHAKWLRENGGGRALDMAQAMRAYRSGQTTGFSDEAKAAEAGAYWRSFGEWFADQVSRWATTQDRPVGVVEQFFKRLADRLRAFFTGERAKFKPDATMAQWLDSLAKDVPPADEVAAQQAEPSAPAEPAPPEQQEGEAGQVERPLYARGDSSLPDEERSQNFRRWSNDAPLVTSSQAGTYQFKSGRKVVVEAFHGTKRPDRVGTVFQRNRATSGPMAFFTSSPLLASSYAEGKQDTSLSYEEQDYANWFKYKPKGERTPVDIVRAWYRLPAETKKRIADLAPRVRFSEEQEEDGGNKIELGPEDHASGTGSYDYNLDETKTRFDPVGNPLKALVEDWLNSANLFNDEERFLQVLRLAGFPVNDIAYDSPHSEYPFVYKAYVFMQKPLVTSDIPQEVRDALNAAAKRDRSRPAQGGADMWDKNTRSLREWVAAFNGDRPEYVWTSIPDKVTEVFKSLGYDGIIDWSGKGGGTEYPVYIPFEETQVKSAIGNKGNFNRDKKDILLARSEPSLWYSELSRKIGEAKMNASNPEGWKAFLSGLPQKGVKPDEIEWSGIREWLGLQQGKVTKQQLLDYLQANGVQVQEVTLGQPENSRYMGIIERAGYSVEANEFGGPALMRDGEYVDADDRSVPQEVRDAMDQLATEADGTPAKYGNYQLPGGQNYREVLLTLPSETDQKSRRLDEQYDGLRLQINELEDQISNSEAEEDTQYLSDELADARAELKAVQAQRSEVQKQAKGEYRSSHWEQPNVLAHIRLNDRTDAEGKRVLFVEELQSDFGQDMRKSKDAIEKAVDNDFDGIIKRMQAAGVLEVECD